MEPFVLGLDTSCYTTSAAIVGPGGPKCESRIPLQVKPGEKGLRQSEALFQHVQNLPGVIRQVRAEYPGPIRAVAVSATPRPQQGSYMPVFLAGVSFAETAASVLGVPCFHTTHQEGHLEAGYRMVDPLPSSEMLAMHVSGGTTELLKAERRTGSWSIELLGATGDISAGQLVDRVGQALGLPFPSGPALEALAARGTPAKVTIPAPARGYEMSYSGPATAALKAIDGGADPADVAMGILLCVARGLAKVLCRAVEQERRRDILLVGGVTANGIIRGELRRALERPDVGARLHFAAPRFCSDNAVGVAFIGLDRCRQRDITPGTAKGPQSEG